MSAVKKLSLSNAFIFAVSIVCIQELAVSITVQKDSIYIINKLPMLGNNGNKLMSSVSNESAIALMYVLRILIYVIKKSIFICNLCIYSDPFDRHKLTVATLKGKNGEWTKVKLLNYQSNTAGGNVNESALDTVFVPTGYCWIQPLHEIQGTPNNGSADSGGREANDRIQENSLYDSRRFGPVSVMCL